MTGPNAPVIRLPYTLYETIFIAWTILEVDENVWIIVIDREHLLTFWKTHNFTPAHCVVDHSGHEVAIRTIFTHPLGNLPLSSSCYNHASWSPSSNSAAWNVSLSKSSSLRAGIRNNSDASGNGLKSWYKILKNLPTCIHTFLTPHKIRHLLHLALWQILPVRFRSYNNAVNQRPATRLRSTLKDQGS